MRRRAGTYECAICGAFLDVSSTQKVRTMLIQSSGQPTERAILADGREIHRCTLNSPVGSRRP